MAKRKPCSLERKLSRCGYVFILPLIFGVCVIWLPNIVQAMEPMFTTDPEGERSGMGFSFMEAFMDEVRVESEPDKGTVVTMKKKING